MSVAIITGATSGIGKAFAWRFARAGHDVVLVARHEDSLAVLAQEIEQYTEVNAQILPADLSLEQGIRTVCERIDDMTNPCAVLVHAAGFALGTEFTTNIEAREQDGLRVMVEATMRLNYHAAQSMQKRGAGAIINLSSMAARMDAGTYSAHKAWVLSFSLALADELRADNIRVLAVTPGPVKTAFFDYAGNSANAMPAFFWVSADQIVDAALHALAQGKAQVTPGILQSITMAAMKIVPSVVVRTISRGGAIPHL
ncbi:dehydrogenase [Galliscardovia ingluviei]|uniref:Dehydrogenase n=1 Tax=Galliscardovia ingluviei TaxID=1769422 RepID=A0A8J3EXQ3_9BIFI|nr:SDR family NAD(P)-dependent oxidoreductase [Galliscardovia ingluviei]GGI15245.1 dehydrogenase [Galliscardovia ingluviei]